MILFYQKIHDILKVLKSSTGIEFSTTKEQRDTKRNGDVPKQIAESVALADKVFGIATLIKSDIVINKEFVSSKTKMDSALSIVTLDSARKLFDLHSKKENMKTVTSQIKTIFTNTSDNDIKRIAEDLIEFDTNLLSFNDDYQKIAKEFTIMETTLTPQVIDFSSYFNRYAIDDSGLKEHMSSDVFKFIIKDTVIFDKLNALFWSGKVKSSTVINYILYKIIDHHLNVKPRSSKECNNVIGEYFPLLVLKAHTFEYPSHLLEDLEEKTSKLADNVIKSAQHLISNINYLDEFKKEEWIQELGGIRVIIGAPRRVLSSYKIFDNYDDLVISSKNSFYDIMLKLRRFKEMRKQKSLYIPQNIDEYLFSFTDVAQGNIHYSEEANILIIPFEVLKFIEINGVKKANIINTLIAKELTKFLITKENFMARNGGTNVYKSKFGKALSCIVEKAKHENIAQTRSISDLEEVTCSIAAIRIAYSAYLTDLVKNPATISRIHGKYGMKNVMNPKIEKNFYLDIKPFLCNINDHQIRNFVDKTIQTFDSYQHAFNCSSPNHVELCHVFPDNHKV
uniref:Peptidase_M13_N domain-containing protein n=1 Tax=Rhabditophanes sp. KR3021 TaxID=114890 RepID=A0AC35U559_9BILA